MHISKQQLEQAAKQNIIDEAQIDPLYRFLIDSSKNVPHFSFTHILYYFGGFLAIAAMSLFIGLSWRSFGGAGIVTLSLIYAVVGLLLTQYFTDKDLTIPAGICATFVVCLTPITIFGAQHWLGMLPDEMEYRYYYQYITSHYLYLELGSILVGAVMAYKYRYPFILLPVTIAIWFLVMDVTALFYGETLTFSIRKLVAIFTGVVMLAAAVITDIKMHKKADYAFWLYLIGALSFWGGLSLLEAKDEVARAIYALVNLLMIGVGALLVRRIFVVLGAIGIFGYLSYLASKLFNDAWLFPIALTLIGLGVIYLGVLWQKHQQPIARTLRQILPQALQNILDARQ